MDPELARAFRRHDGLLTRPEALAAGVAPQQIARWLRSGAWTTVRHGVYAESAGWRALDPYRGQPRQVSRATSLVMTMPHVLSHDSAALEWDLPLLHRRAFMPHITRFGVHGSRTKAGVKHHRAGFESAQIDFVDGFPVLDRARTAVDLAREHGLDAGVVACDAALRQGVERSELAAAVEPMAYWPMVRTVRRAVELADPGAQTPGESLMRLLVLGLGLGPVESQFGLSDGRRTYWCDLRVGRHIFEFDGRVKYRPLEAGGVVRGSVEEVLWAEKVRSDWLGSLGLGMSRVYWEHLFGASRRATERRLLADVARTRARFGDDIADLAPYVVRAA